MYQTGVIEHPELSSIRSLLNAAKIVALIFWILGILWMLATIAAIAFLAAVGYFGAGVLNLGYPILFFILNLLLWMQIPAIERLVAQGQYAAAKEKTVLWFILGLISGFIVGLLLLIAYLKFDNVIAWRGAMGQPGAPPGYAQVPTASWAPAPYSTPQSVPPPPAPAAAAPPPPPVAPAASPPGAACPRCGRPATWVAQYNRWYCYSCQQYV